jgi:hypothetical protein
MQQRADKQAPTDVRGDLTSADPATGKQIWSGTIGDAAAEVTAARAAAPAWAAHSPAFRIEALRRFANAVREQEAKFAELISRETGKPYWEARTEVGAVVNKVEISIEAYAERSPQRKLEGAMGNKIAVRHKPHGVLAVLGPYNFPAHLPNGHIVPALIAGNAVVFKPSEKTPATGEFLVRCFHEAKVPEGVVRLLIGGPDQGKALAAEESGWQYTPDKSAVVFASPITLESGGTVGTLVLAYSLKFVKESTDKARADKKDAFNKATFTTIGIGLGFGLSAAVQKFMQWPADISSNAIALAFGFAALTGVFFGFYPARKAARLDPIEALRFE